MTTFVDEWHVFSQNRVKPIPKCHGKPMDVMKDRFRCKTCKYVVQDKDMKADYLEERKRQREQPAPPEDPEHHVQVLVTPE